MALAHPDVDELLGAIRGGGGIDVACKGVELVLQALAEAEATERTGTARYERGEALRAQRNG